jgi:hypothetical protein
MLGEEQCKSLIYNNLHHYNILHVVLKIVVKRLVTYKWQACGMNCTFKSVWICRFPSDYVKFCGPNMIVRTGQPLE